MARVLKQEKALEEAVKVLKQGGVIIYPTETSYGVGADALNPEAIAKVHEAKQQPHDKPISVIVADEKQAEEIAEIGEKERKLIHNFMPGPLTLIAKKHNIVPKQLTSNGIAFRISSNEFARALASKFGHAITATSANLHGQPAVYSAKKTIEVFGKKVDLVVDAGELPRREPSTIYNLINKKIIREGPVSKEEILKAIS